MSISLYDAVKASYGNRESKRNIESQGYVYDKALSNHNEKVYYNKNDSKLLFLTAGTHNLSDWSVDRWLGSGHLKKTQRYQGAKQKLNQAKEKYHPKKTVLSGHSLGGSISQGIASRNDEVNTLDSGYTIGQTTRANTKEYRSQGDVVSLLGANAKHSTTLNHGNFFSRHKHAIAGALTLNPLALGVGLVSDAVRNHNVDNIKNEKIFV